MSRTDLSSLYDLCSQALLRQTAELEGARTRQETEDRREAVTRALLRTEALLGTEAADALGEWAPVDEMATDTLQAFTRLTPGAYLLHTSHAEDGEWLELVSHCAKCGHDRTARITSLESLATAINDAGLR